MANKTVVLAIFDDEASADAAAASLKGSGVAHLLGEGHALAGGQARRDHRRTLAAGPRAALPERGPARVRPPPGPVHDRASEPERLQRVPKYRPTLVDPYRDHLRKRRAEEPGVPVRYLLREIRQRGYQGSSNLLVRYINQGRLDSDRPHLSPRQAARILLTRPDRLTGDPPLMATPNRQICAQAIGAFDRADRTSYSAIRPADHRAPVTDCSLR